MTSETTIFRGGKAYTADAYRAAFGALPPGAERRATPAAAAPNPASQAATLQTPAEAAAALRALVATPISRARSRELMLTEVAKLGGSRTSADSPPASSMRRELARQGLKPVGGG